ncbi:hypothetical protein AVEN_222182-1 [Araneus ventricosus]|uniref:Uncharacterized protein n=1 Tax=Araneus ventricosus TaxID=182803 RepID=A0A4Y2NBQ9_ARAVE|nr:hypothetical protein AVEN_222182-1 [Araneus ventricosus]
MYVPSSLPNGCTNFDETLCASSSLANLKYCRATDDADVHFVKTAIETHEKIKKQVVVIVQDVDLIVLPTDLTPDHMDILMLKEGKGKIKDRFYSSKDLQNSNLVIECTQKIMISSLLVLFVLSIPVSGQFYGYPGGAGGAAASAAAAGGGGGYGYPYYGYGHHGYWHG